MSIDQVANWFINTRRRKLPKIAKQKLAEQEERDARVARGEELTAEEKLIPRITQERIDEILGRVHKEQVELKVHRDKAELQTKVEGEPSSMQQNSNRGYRFESLGGDEGSEESDIIGSPSGDEMAVPRSMNGSHRARNGLGPTDASSVGLKIRNNPL